jgi:hypothetical protein
MFAFHPLPSVVVRVSGRRCHSGSGVVAPDGGDYLGQQSPVDLRRDAMRISSGRVVEKAADRLTVVVGRAKTTCRTSKLTKPVRTTSLACGECSATTPTTSASGRRLTSRCSEMSWPRVVHVLNMRGANSSAHLRRSQWMARTVEASPGVEPEVTRFADGALRRERREAVGPVRTRGHIGTPERDVVRAEGFEPSQPRAPVLQAGPTLPRRRARMRSCSHHARRRPHEVGTRAGIRTRDTRCVGPVLLPLSYTSVRSLLRWRLRRICALGGTRTHVP